MQLTANNSRACSGRTTHSLTRSSRPSRPARLSVGRQQQQQQQQARRVVTHFAHPDAEDAIVTPSATSKCPMLRALALAQAPTAAVPWHKRIMQFAQPLEFQSQLLAGGHPVVRTPAQVGFPELAVTGTAELSRAVLLKEGDLSRPVQMERVGALIGEDGILAMPPAVHKVLRAVLAPAFNADAVALLVPDIVSIAADALQAWEAATAAGQPVSGYSGITQMTFQVIVQVMLGSQSAERLAYLHGLFIQFMGGLAAWPAIDLPFTAFGKALAAKRQLMDIFLNEIETTRAKLAAGEPVEGRIGALVAAKDLEGKELTDSAIAENLIAALFAGHDTTSTALADLVVALQDNPHVMAKLRQEQQELQAQHGDTITACVLKNMTYADAVIRESLRVKPVVADTNRVAARDIELGGCLIKKDTMLLVPQLYLAANDPLWKDATGDMQPAVFNPDRFLSPQAIKSPHQMPFGVGPRFCLGYHLAQAELKVFMCLLARHYNFSVDADTEWIQQVGRTPVNGLPMTVSKL